MLIIVGHNEFRGAGNAHLLSNDKPDCATASRKARFGSSKARRSPVGMDIALGQYTNPGHLPLGNTNMKTPLIVTHPSTLLHDGLRRIFAKSHFGPLFIAPNLSEELESQMRSFDTCIWLVGVSRYDFTINDLLRRVTTDAQGAKPVIFSAYQAPGDMVTALKGRGLRVSPSGHFG